jgi:hypothetical protein
LNSWTNSRQDAPAHWGGGSDGSVWVLRRLLDRCDMSGCLRYKQPFSVAQPQSVHWVSRKITSKPPLDRRQ